MHNWPPLSAITCHTHICIGYKSALVTCHPRMLHSLCIILIQHHKFIQCGQKCSHHNSSGSSNAFKQLKSKTTHLDLSANTNVVWASRFKLGIHKGITYWTVDVTSFSDSIDTHLIFAHISLQHSMVSPIYLGHDIYTFNTTTRQVSISKLSFSTLPTGFMKEMILT